MRPTIHSLALMSPCPCEVYRVLLPPRPSGSLALAQARGAGPLAACREAPHFVRAGARGRERVAGVAWRRALGRRTPTVPPHDRVARPGQLAVAGRKSLPAAEPRSFRHPALVAPASQADQSSLARHKKIRAPWGCAGSTPLPVTRARNGTHIPGPAVVSPPRRKNARGRLSLACVVVAAAARGEGSRTCSGLAPAAVSIGRAAAGKLMEGGGASTRCQD